MYSAVLMLAMTTGADATECGRGGGYGGCCYSYGDCYSYGGYGGCYSYGGYGGYGGCGFVGYGGLGGYGAAYPMFSNETPEEYAFCQEQATKMPAEAYATFRSEWGRLSNQQRKAKMDAQKKGGGSSSLALPARILVSLPADAKLLIDDKGTTSVGASRVFVSPPLTPQGDYQYTLKAEFVRDGKTVSLSKNVPVAAGKDTQVSFDETPAVATASK